MSGCFPTDGSCQCQLCVNKFSQSISNILKIDDVKPVKLANDNEILKQLQAEYTLLSNRINRIKNFARELNDIIKKMTSTQTQIMTRLEKLEKRFSAIS